MQQQLQDWRAAQQSAGAGKAAGGSDLNRIARDAEKSGNAFDRVMGRQNAVHSSTDAAQLAKLKELEDLSRNNRIAERLAALKAGNKFSDDLLYQKGSSENGTMKVTTG